MPSIPILRRYHTARSTSSRASEESQDSQSTAPTSLHSSTRPSSYKHASIDRYMGAPFDTSPSTTFYPRSSTETYASSESEEELCEDVETIDPEFEVPEYKEVVEADLRPSSPREFGKLFPSTKRLYIRHDDTTYDGNMNLRVDIEARDGMVQLFHLRMQDLKEREVSLRRYERASGREVCHSTRTYSKPASERRPRLTKTVSHAFASMVGKPDLKRSPSTRSSSSSKSPKARRQNSAYAADEEDANCIAECPEEHEVPVPRNVIKLEFANYAHVDIKRRGPKSSRLYEFEYWGTDYHWKQMTEKDGDGTAISYHLYNVDGGQAIAHIVPEMRTPTQFQQDVEANNWVPPCSMWISDARVFDIVSDIGE